MNTIIYHNDNYLPLIKPVAFNNNYLPLIKIFTVDNYYLSLMKIFTLNKNINDWRKLLNVNDISLTYDKTTKSYLVMVPPVNI